MKMRVVQEEITMPKRESRKHASHMNPRDFSKSRCTNTRPDESLRTWGFPGHMDMIMTIKINVSAGSSHPESVV